MTYYPLWLKGLTFVAAAVCLGMQSWPGLLYFGLGVGATALFLLGTWQAILLFGRLMKQGEKPVRTMTAFFIAIGFKLPIFILLGLWIRDVNFSLQACFLGGLALVYSWLIGWAVTSANREATS